VTGPGELRLDGRPVARLNDGGELPDDHSPRPFLHPLLSPAGVEVTALAPADHPWHAGLSLAIADVDGDNYWGGNTFVPGQGYVLLDDHGRIDPVAPADVVDGRGVRLELVWRNRSGRIVLRERRAVDAAWVEVRHAWRVTARSALTNVSGRGLAFGSPGTRGRPDAGYGGWTLRLADRFRGATVTTSAGPEVPGGVGEAAMGRPARWIGYRGGGVVVVVVALAAVGEPLPPWYVRVDEFPAVGPAPFSHRVRSVPPGGVLRLGVTVVVADGEQAPSTLAAAAG
jgi:Methane oxygenase PmoA